MVAAKKHVPIVKKRTSSPRHLHLWDPSLRSKKRWRRPFFPFHLCGRDRASHYASVMQTEKKGQRGSNERNETDLGDAFQRNENTDQEMLLQALRASFATRATDSSASIPAGASPRVLTTVSEDVSVEPRPCPPYVASYNCIRTSQRRSLGCPL